MKILETAIRQRTFDGMWMLLIKTLDYDNTYRYRGEDDKFTSWTPTMWIIADVKSEKEQLRFKKERTSYHA
jgi:hypothetical protein